MATAGAVEDPYLDSLVARYAKGVSVIREGAQSLVSFVERRAAAAGSDERREAVGPFVKPLVERGADEIVLACTHFLHLRDDIAAVAGPGVEVVDSRAGVVKRLKQVLSERGLLRSAAEGRNDSTRLFLLSGDPPFEEEYGLWAKAFGLEGPFALGEIPAACCGIPAGR
jgi:glutamate racemase